MEGWHYGKYSDDSSYITKSDTDLEFPYEMLHKVWITNNIKKLFIKDVDDNILFLIISSTNSMSFPMNLDASNLHHLGYQSDEEIEKYEEIVNERGFFLINSMPPK